MNILYVCTHNRCRSILSEAITNHLAKGKIQAFSAGSQPAGVVHPLSLQYLRELGISTLGLQSQSWDDFTDKDIDIVITVCDNAAAETCPVWFGNAIKEHWSLPDPSKLQASEADIRAAFFAVMTTIEQRVAKLMTLDWDTLNHEERVLHLHNLVEAL